MLHLPQFWVDLQFYYKNLFTKAIYVCYRTLENTDKSKLKSKYHLSTSKRLPPLTFKCIHFWVYIHVFWANIFLSVWFQYSDEMCFVINKWNLLIIFCFCFNEKINFFVKRMTGKQSRWTKEREAWTSKEIQNQLRMNSSLL